MRTDAYMKRTCYSIAHTAWLDCLIDDDDGDDALNAIDEISVKNKLYRTQKLFRTPNVDEYTTILSEISIFRSKRHHHRRHSTIICLL